MLANTGYDEWKLDQPKVIAFDTETTGLEFHDVAFGASIAWVHDDVLTGQREVRGHWFDFDHAPDAHGIVADIIAGADQLVAHNAKFDLHKLEAQGIVLRPDQVLHDTEAMSHLLNEHRPKGLKALAIDVLKFDDTIMVPGKRKNPDTGKQEDVVRPKARSSVEMSKAKEWAKKQYGLKSVKEVGYHLLPRGVLVPYAVLDAVWTFQLANVFWPALVAEYGDDIALYWREMALSRGSIYNIEKAGMRTDRAYIEAQVKTYSTKRYQHELAIEQIVGKPVRTGKIPPKERAEFFNPSGSSPDAGAFFEATGNGRENYDAEQLRTINHPLAARLLEYRKDIKILDSYFIALQKAVGADDLFHPAIRQHGTVSGRTSAGSERGD